MNYESEAYPGELNILRTIIDVYIFQSIEKAGIEATYELFNSTPHSARIFQDYLLRKAIKDKHVELKSKVKNE
jgi:hypothetical protein